MSSAVKYAIADHYSEGVLESQDIIERAIASVRQQELAIDESFDELYEHIFE